ncbi:MAG: NADP-dependent phosphogluconate dehydrogenase [Patescibacteria group bacterium]
MQKELVFIGLGRMGAAMTAHLVEQGFTIHGSDVNEAARTAAAKEGVHVHASIEEAIAAMPGKKIIWIMVPSKFVDDVLGEVFAHTTAGDIVIDGGNTFYKDTLRRAALAASKNISYVDCGTSGGMEGARHGAALMVGGKKEDVAAVEHIFKALATAGGYGHVGAVGAGHFVKMVHNGIEYGMMGAIAEGLNAIKQHATEFEIDELCVLDPYEHESIITSKLVSWTADALKIPGYIDSISGEVPRGETESEMEHLTTIAPMKILETALEQRKAERTNPSYIGQLISAMRNQFGGHQVIKKGE